MIFLRRCILKECELFWDVSALSFKKARTTLVREISATITTTGVGISIRTPTLVLLYQNRLFTDTPATKILLELTVATLLWLLWHSTLFYRFY
jgi:hypothetical protein